MSSFEGLALCLVERPCNLYCLLSLPLPLSLDLKESENISTNAADDDAA